MRTLKIVSALFLTGLIAACGGGGGGSSPPASNTVSGYTAKGPISNAQVWVFKAADYSTPLDTTKALNANVPTMTDSTGHYSVNVGSYSGPVVVVAQSTATSTMLNEVTGATGPVATGFVMHAVAASLVANSTIHVTPYTEMAASAVVASNTLATANAAAAINTANAVVRTSILPGLDPLTTSPVVVSSAPASEQAASQQMTVALAAVVQAGQGMVGATNCAAAIDPTQCAVSVLSGTVATIDGVNNTATIDARNVAAISAAMNTLGTVNVPTLGTAGNITSTSLNTTADPAAATLKTSVANTSATLTASADPVTGQTPATPPSTTLLNGVTQAKAFFSDLRTNVHLFSNSSKTGLLDQQSARFKNDMSGNIAPKVSHVASLVRALGDGMSLFSNSASLSPNCVRNTNGTVTCRVDTTNNPFFMNFPGMVRTTVEITLTSSSTNAASYTATALQCTVDINYACTPAVDTSKATGSGTLSRTVDASGKTTSVTINGTLPGSNSGIVQEHLVLSASGMNPAGSSGQVDLSGSVSGYGGTPSAVGTTPISSISLDAGSYGRFQDVVHTKVQTFICDVMGCRWTCVACSANCTSPELTAFHVSLTASVRDTRFNGTLDMGGFMFDKSNASWSPTSITFNGTITDTALGGNGAFLAGRLTLTSTGYANFDVTQPVSATNFETATASFNGNITFPNERPVNLVLNAGNTGYRTGTVSVNFTYGNGKSISVNSATFNNAPGSMQTVTLTNQDGLKITFDNTPTVKVLAGSDLVATVTGNTIHYSDGYMESLN